jgi:DNA-binding transcriptional MerR regulator
MSLDLDLMTTDEVAAELRVSPSTVRYWRQTKYGPKGTRVGKRVLYERAEIISWLGRLKLQP